jgi:hypothetical protein
MINVHELFSKINSVFVSKKGNYYLIFFTIILSTLFLISPIEFPTFLSFFSLIFFSTIIGHAALIHTSTINQLIWPVRITIYTGVGFFLSMLWILSFSIFSLNPIFYYFLIILSCGLILFKLKKTNNLITLFPNFSQVTKNLKPILLSIIFLLIIFYLVVIQSYFDWWYPYGDAISHSIISAIQNLSGKLTLEIPNDVIPLRAPMSSYEFSSSLSLFFNLMLPEMYLIISSIGMLLIILCSVSIVYHYSKSLLLVSIITLSFFIVNQIDISGDSSLWGFYVAGVIPNLLVMSGILIIPLLLIEKNTRYVFLVILLISLSLILIYPSVSFYIFLLLTSFIILKFIKPFKFGSNQKNDFKLSQFIPISLPFFILAISFFLFYDGTIITIFDNLLLRSASPNTFMSAYAFDSGYPVLNDTFFFYSMILGIFSSLFLLLFSKSERYLGLFWLSFFFLVFDSNIFKIFDLFSFTVRFSNLLPVFSMINCGITLYILSNNSNLLGKKFTNFKFKNSFIYFRKYFIISLFGLLILLLVGMHFDILKENVLPTKLSRTHDFHPYLPGSIKLTEMVNPQDITYSFIFQNDNAGSSDGTSMRFFNWIPAIKYSQFISHDIKQTVPHLGNDVLNLIHQEMISEHPFMLKLLFNELSIDYVITDNFPPESDKLKKLNFLKLVYEDGYSNIYVVLDTEDIDKVKVEIANNLFNNIPISLLLYPIYFQLENDHIEEFSNNIIFINEYNDLIVFKSNTLDVTNTSLYLEFLEFYNSKRVDTELDLFSTIVENQHPSGINPNLFPILFPAFSNLVFESMVDSNYVIVNTPSTSFSYFQNNVNYKIINSLGNYSVFEKKLQDELTRSSQFGEIEDIDSSEKFFMAILTMDDPIDDMFDMYDVINKINLDDNKKVGIMNDAKSYLQKLPSSNMDAVMEKHITDLYLAIILTESNHFLDRGDFKFALKNYNKIFSEIRYPNSKNTEQYNDLLLNKALILENLERFSLAKNVYQKVLLIDKNNTIAIERLSKLE